MPEVGSSSKWIRAAYVPVTNGTYRLSTSDCVVPDLAPSVLALRSSASAPSAPVSSGKDTPEAFQVFSTPGPPAEVRTTQPFLPSAGSEAPE